MTPIITVVSVISGFLVAVFVVALGNVNKAHDNVEGVGKIFDKFYHRRHLREELEKEFHDGMESASQETKAEVGKVLSLIEDMQKDQNAFYTQQNSNSEQLKSKMEEVSEQVDFLQTAIDDLTQSDVDQMRALFIAQHQKYYNEQHYISEMALDSLEKVYQDYVKKGGNGYVTRLMNEIRTLPRESEYKIRKEKRDE